MAKRRQGRAFWAKLISEFESNAGGESHAAFAARNGVRLTTFRSNRTAQDVGSGRARTPAVGEQVVDLRGRVILDS
jgi:hypothetical protein